MMRHHHRFRFFLVGLLLWTGCLVAQSDDSGRELEDELAWLRSESVEITVASLIAEQPYYAPSSVTVFTGREIREMGIRDVYELLNFVPGYQMHRNVDTSDLQGVSVRGRSRSAQMHDVLVLLDGQRLNEPSGGSANFPNPNISVENIKQVEIIRGPGSALYGANAFLGVISIKTDEKKRNVGLRYGSFDNRDAYVNFSHQDGKLILSGFMRGFADDGDEFGTQTDFIGQQVDNVQDPRHGGEASLNFGLNDWRLRLRQQRRKFFNYYQDGFIGEINKTDIEHSFARIAYEPEPFDRWSLTFSAGYALTEWEALEATPLGSLGPLQDSFYGDITADVSYEMSDANTLNFGVTAASEGIKNSHFLTPAGTLPGPGPLPTKSRGIYAAYLQDRFYMGPLEVTAGVRYDHFSDFGSAVSPRLAVLYGTPWDGKLKLMYGEAFRAPSLGFTLVDNPAQQGNPNLDPETIRTFETAYLQKYKDHEIGVAFFRNQINDSIQDYYDAGFVQNYENADKSEISEGLEFDLKLALAEGLYLRGNFSHLLSSVDSNSSRNFGSAILNYRVRRLNVNLSTTYHGEISDLATEDAYFVVGASVRYEFACGLTAQVTAQDLFDEDPLRPSQKLGSVEDRGQRFWAGVEYAF